MRHTLTAYHVGTGEREQLVYDTDAHVFTLAGEIITPPPFSPIPPRPGVTVRIALGHKCNFTCAYCSQCKSEERTDSLTPEGLARAMDAYFGTHIQVSQIQYWGGEPMVYLDYIQKFHAAFKAIREGERIFGTSSNGSLLLKSSVTDWLLENGVCMAFSHDGPGQAYRGPDLLRVPEVRKNLIRLHEAGMTHLQPCMHRLNPSLAECSRYINNIVGVALPVIACKLLNIYDQEQMRLALPVEDLAAYSRQRYYDHLQGLAVPMDVTNAIKLFLMGYGDPKNPGLGCHVMDPYTMVLDTAGNILTCQNFTAADLDECGDPHKLGSILDANYENHRPRAHLSRLKKREEGCRDCLVYRLCKGGCAYTTDEYMAYNCKARYHENLVTLGLAFTHMTGGEWLLGDVFGDTPHV